MKKSLFLYLFILAGLFNVFTYMYYSKALEFEQKKYTKTADFDKKVTDSLTNLMADANYFSLENNDYARDYFEKYEIKSLIPKISEALLSYNDDPKGNKYIGQETLGTQKFIINKLKILNHRWIVADYSDGTYWGNVFIKYFLNDDGTFTFITQDTFLFPKQQY
ncbi:MAG: hypothetical protein H7239_10775 [Flavobacterium sp.]|nr:hypothetical protein [Flavobacterium sp.]